jgi:IS5 family transposase
VPATTPPAPLFIHPSDLAQQRVIRLPLPIVEGNCDYLQREAELRRMDEVLIRSGIEDACIAHHIAVARSAAGAAAKPLSDRRRATIQRQARQGLRCTVARILSNESHRSFSCHLAESALLQWFCGIRFDGIVRVPSKSTLQRMEAEVPAEVLHELNVLLLRRSTETDADGASTIGLAESVDLSLLWMDATCAKLDIHYPTDWILLRDACRTIMKAIITIRSHGLRHRMPAPERFIARMNAQCMAMSGASRRGRDGRGGDCTKKKARKATLRTMKEIVGTVRKHGLRYRDMLASSWRETDLSEREAQRIVERIDGVIAQLPDAIRQAHERIIGERVVPNAEKTLSLYQPHAQVYVRGKSGADAEFGLQMLLSESAEGLIIDCHLLPDITSDSALLMPAIARMRQRFGDQVARTVVTDRGFSSAANDAALAAASITNMTLPRNPEKMQRHLQDPTVQKLQKRRAQTEARIGIFKANFLGDHLPTKNWQAQERFVAWATLAHNLWVLAKLEQAAKPLAQAG